MSERLAEIKRGLGAADRRLWLSGGVVLLVLLGWMFWPSGKPPERCLGKSYRPGQVVSSMMMGTAFLVGSDCQLSKEPATPEQIAQSEALTKRWAAYEHEQGINAFPAPTNPIEQLMPSWLKPFLWFFGAVFGVWGVLLGVALIVFLIGFIVVVVVGLRHAPLLVITAPIMFWWKILIEIPKGLGLQLIDVAQSKAEAGKVQKMAWQGLLQLIGLGKLEQPSDHGDLGSATFGTSTDVQAKDIITKGRAALNVGKIEGQPLQWHTDKHVLILAGSRAGKGRDLIIPNLLSYQGSVFVIDPKGENFEKSARYRATLGKVRALDPWGVTKLPASLRTRFNPLALLDKENPESVDLADVLAHGLVLPSGNDNHWSESARALWKALLLHVATADEFEGQRDLVTARQILLSYFLPSKDNTTEGQTSTLEGMIANDAFDGIISEFALSLQATPEEERGSIISNAQRQTDFLDTPALRASLAATGEGKQINFAEWRSLVMSCYLCIPADKLEGSGLRWVRIVVSAALNEMLREQKPPELPVQFILDELASLKRLEQVERALGLAAGYGVQLWAVWQDIAQMRDLYASRWASFIGNAGARFVFGVGDYDTAKYFSDYMGQATRVVTAHQADALGMRLSGQSRSIQTRPLMTPDEIMVMDGTEMLVLLDRVRPIKATRTSWFDDQTLKQRAESIG